jgi:hypothetical protein
VSTLPLNNRWYRRGIATVQRSLSSSDDWIVLTHSMRTLARLAEHDEPVRHNLMQRLDELRSDPRRAIAPARQQTSPTTHTHLPHDPGSRVDSSPKLARSAKSAAAIAAGSVGPWDPGGISEYQERTGRQLAEDRGEPYESFGASVDPTEA